MSGPVPAGAVPKRAAIGSFAHQTPAAVAEAVRSLPVDMDHMRGHGVLGGIERIVERGEVRLELIEIRPMRRRAVIGVHIGGEDRVEQAPLLAVDGQPIRDSPAA